MNTNQTNQEKPSSDVAKKSISKKLLGENPLPTIILSLISEVILFAMFSLITPLQTLFDLPVQVKDLSENINLKNDTLDAISKSIEDLNEKYHNLDKRLSVIEDRNGLYTAKIKPSEELKKYIQTTFMYENSPYGSVTSIKDFSVLGRDTDTGEECILENLISQSILTQYVDGEKDIVFYGEINSNNCWDGNCVINIYENGTLKSIMDAIYDNGVLKTYKQVLRFTTDSNIDVWSISNRKKELEYDSGESWHYLYKDYPISFDINSIEAENIITSKVFEDFIKSSSYLEGYYYGNISDGLYNDNTGTAQRITYSEDGTIQMLYVGEFQDGKLTDYTGNAWYIVLGYDNTNYYYYNGRFDNARRIDNKKPEKISFEEIQEKIRSIHFNCELTWKGN